MHFHASQFPNRELCLDAQLLEWLEQCTFPQEAKYNNLLYARKVYSNLIDTLWEAGTTRILMFTTIHKNFTKLLLDMLIQSGLGAFVGKINMDMNAPEVFYMGTKGGGSFWGKVGSFEEGYDFDALVIDDSSLNSFDYTLEQRIKIFIYLGNGNSIVERFVAGRQIKRANFDES